MVSPTTRAAKGSELTWPELDANFTTPAAALNFLFPADVSFATAIPFTGNLYMPQQTVSGPLAFTVAAGGQKGAHTYLRLVADGTNAPTFTGFKEWGGSSVYDNRSGITNQIEFWYDGYDYWYYVNQAVGAVAVDTVAPTASSAAVANASPTVVAIAMSEAIDPSFVPAASAFAVSGHTVSTVAVSGATINLTVTAAFVNGEAARTVSYTQPGTNNARDIAGNLLASFSALAITNNVLPVDTTAPTVVSAQVANGAPTVIAIAMSEALDAASVPATTAFAASGGKTVSAVAISGSVINVTVNSAYANGDTITVTYTQPGSNKIKDAAGNATASFGPSAVTNNISGAVFPRLSLLSSGYVESGSGPYTYTIGSAGSGFGAAIGGISTTGLQSGIDGSLSQTFTGFSGGAEIGMGINSGGTLVSFSSLPYFFYASQASGYKPFTGGTNNTPTNAVTPAAGDIMRMRRTGTTLVAEVSKDSGATWTTIYTWTGVSTGALKFQAAMTSGAAASATLVAGTGLA